MGFSIFYRILEAKSTENIISYVQEDQGKVKVKNKNVVSTIQFFYLLSDNLTFNTSIILGICNDRN